MATFCFVKIYFRNSKFTRSKLILIIMKLLSKLIILVLATFFCVNVQAKDGHKIEIKIKDYDAEYCFLTGYYGNKKYVIKDTLFRTKKGLYVAEGEESLATGLYAVLLPPKNLPFELMISSENDQHFSIESDTTELIKNLKIKGSEENAAFYDYLRFRGEKNQALSELQKQGEGEENEKKKQKLGDKISALKDEIKQYEQDYISKHQGWLSTAMIKASIDVKVPDSAEKMTEEEESKYRMYYYRNHYFDNLDFSDDRLLRSPVYFNKIDFFLNKLTYQVPDSLTKSVDYILEKARANDKLYRYTVFEMASRYGNSKVIGMDAVFVHIVENYVKGKTFDDVDEDNVAKIIKTAREFKPLLIGKKAPNITMQTLDGEDIQLYDMDADYTVLYIWDPKCGHCKKMAPKVVEFYENYKDKGVEVFAICTKDKEREQCMEFIESKNFGAFTNVLAMTNQQLYYRLKYRIKSTPIIYVLDKDKTIKMKNIGAQHLPQVMDAIMNDELN